VGSEEQRGRRVWGDIYAMRLYAGKGPIRRIAYIGGRADVTRIRFTSGQGEGSGGKCGEKNEPRTEEIVERQVRVFRRFEPLVRRGYLIFFDC
jgi:hypothetical protein